MILCASRETLWKRQASRLEGRRFWAALQMDRCLRAFAEDIAGHRLQTEGLTIDQVVEQTAELAGLTLAKTAGAACGRPLTGRRFRSGISDSTRFSFRRCISRISIL